MKTLKLNARQHRFALNILAGQEPRTAFLDAGYSPASVLCSPYTLQNEPSVAKFIQEQRAKQTAVVTAKVANDAIASPTERKEILTDLLRAQLVDFQDAQGEPNLTKDTPHARAAKEYTHRRNVDRNGNEVVHKSIKLTDIVSAIQELNKMDGSYAPRRSLIASKVVIELKPYRRLKEGQEDAVIESPDNDQREGF